MLSNILKSARDTPSSYWAFIASAQSLTTTVVVPATAQSGDLIVLANSRYQTFTTTIPPNGVPTDFIQITTSTGVVTGGSNAVARVTTSYYFGATNKAGATLTGMTNSGGDRKSVV
jgi:hypothetical protein